MCNKWSPEKYQNIDLALLIYLPLNAVLPKTSALELQFLLRNDLLIISFYQSLPSFLNRYNNFRQASLQLSKQEVSASGRKGRREVRNIVSIEHYCESTERTMNGEEGRKGKGQGGLKGITRGARNQKPRCRHVQLCL